MADTPASPSTSPRGHNRPRGGFRHHNPQSDLSSQSDRSRGRRGGRGGRGGRLRGNSFNNRTAMGPVTETGQPPGLGGGGSFGDRLTGDASTTEDEDHGKGKMVEAVLKEANGATEEQEEGVEAEVCFICASPVVHNSVSPCNHRTCHICALRLRALYKNKLCAHCRTEADYVIFTDDASKRYEDFTERHFAKTDDNLGIMYEKDEIYEDTVLLLRYNCPDNDCDVACLGWPDLHRHVKNVHQKTMCDLCIRNKKVFAHEHELFTMALLRRHERYGDDNPGAVDQSGFRGHPECGFCRERFYGDDELYVHCREKHERCHLCDRRNEGRQQQYYVNYNSLEDHFRKDHFPCFDPECQEKKFVVFESEMDLKGHQLQAHPNSLSKDARRDAQRVDISGFDYRAPHQPTRGRGREGRGAGRGRDPTTEPIPQSSAQPVGRAELAYQRQMAIQSASQSIAPRTFGGQLTQTVEALTQTYQPTRTATPPQSLPPPLDLSLDSAQTPQERSRALAHTSVITRASTLLDNNASKVSIFRTHVSSYRSDSISAPALVTAFFSLFDVPSADLGKLIQELAEIYESDTKRNDLLRAWNDWRAVNEDYPALPGNQAPSGSANLGGKRVLKLKSSTAQSSRSAVSRQASWGLSDSGSSRTGRSNTSSNPISNPFPALPASSNRTGQSQSSRIIPWATPSASTSNPPSNPPSRPSSTRPLNTKPPAGDAFPALPAAAKPNTLMAGLTKGSIRWNDQRSPAPQANVWGPGMPMNSDMNISGNDVRDDDSSGAGAGAGGGKKGKGKGKKQVLYSFG